MNEVMVAIRSNNANLQQSSETHVRKYAFEMVFDFLKLQYSWEMHPKVPIVSPRKIL